MASKSINMTLALAITALTALGSASTSAVECEVNGSFKANSGTWNNRTGVGHYKGDIEYCEDHSKILASEVKIFDQQGKPKRMLATGKPARILHTDPQTNAETLIRAEQIEYFPDSGQLIAVGDAYLKQIDTPENQQAEIWASNINVSQSNDQFSKIIAIGNRARFKHRGVASSPPYAAFARQIIYENDSAEIELTGDVLIEQDGNLTNAEKIFYNTKTRLATAPPVKGERVEFIMNNKRNENPTDKDQSK